LIGILGMQLFYYITNISNRMSNAIERTLYKMHITHYFECIL